METQNQEQKPNNKLIKFYIAYILCILLLIAAGYIIYKLHSDGGKCMQDPGAYWSNEYKKYNDNEPVRCEGFLAQGERIKINENGTFIFYNSFSKQEDLYKINFSLNK